MTALVRRDTFVVNGVASPVLAAGAREATEAVVFVHGNPGPASDWSDLLGRTGRFARAVAPNMPGFGGAERPQGFRCDVTGYAEHLGSVIRELGIDRAHVVAHDFGGPWALAWAAANPQRCASVTLINTGVLPGYKWHRLARIWRTPVVGEAFWLLSSRRIFNALVRHENPRLPQAAIDELFDAFRHAGTSKTILELYRASPASAARGPIEQLRALDLPALVLWGTADAYIPWTFAERQLEAFPSAHLHLLEELGHWPFHEDPGQVAELVIPFLQSQLGDGPEDPRPTARSRTRGRAAA